MKPTEELKQEHREIEVMLAIMNNVADRLDAGEEIDPVRLEQIVEFLRVFADSCHHGKEEGLLFKELEAAGMPAEGGPISVMLQEHDMGRSFVAKLSDAIARYRNGDPEAPAEIADNARKYVQLLGAHIQKEDNVLYPLADDRLTPEAQNRLETGFKRVETDMIGPGRHEQFHAQLHEMRDEFLNR